MAKRKIQKKNHLVAIVIILIMLISIGYAALTTTLNINGTANISVAQWSVYFDNVQVKDGSVEADIPVIDNDSNGTVNTVVTYEVDMSTPGEFYEFNVDIVNDGTIDAMLDKLVISTLDTDQAKYLDYIVTYADGGEIGKNGAKDLLKSKETETIKVGLYFKTEIESTDLPSENDKISATVKMEYVQADNTAVERKKAVKVSNSLIGKYVDLGKNVVGTEATTDDWRLLYVDEGTKTTYLILADYLPAGQMQAGTGILNNGKYNVYASGNRDNFLDYFNDSTKWNNLIDSEITGATVKGATTIEIMESSYQAKYGAYWNPTTTKNDKLYIPHPDEWNDCWGYWLASPNSNNSLSVWFVNCAGDFNNNRYYYIDRSGLRPVVSLSSDIALNVVD